MCDYQESVTTGQTDGQTDAGQIDLYVPLCFAGDTKGDPYVALCFAGATKFAKSKKLIDRTALDGTNGK